MVKLRRCTKPYRRSSWLPVAVSTLAVASSLGCTASNQDSAVNDPDTRVSVGEAERPLEEREDSRRREVKLALTDWTGSRINVAIAEILIERQLGYPVTLVPVADLESMLSDVADGELDAALELWPASLSPEETELVDGGGVDDLGPLGVDGKVGWYVPRYVIDEHPELRSWVGLANPAGARLFATAETGEKGRLLGIDPAYQQFDEDLVDALELDLEVVFAGSEDAVRAELIQATARREPILLYWWSPTAEIAEYDLVNIALPARSSECVEAHQSGELMRCDYPIDELYKIAAPELRIQDPELHGLLSAFSLSTEEQIGMIHAVEVDGRSIADVASAWVEGNRDRWAAWLEPTE